MRALLFSLLGSVLIVGLEFRPGMVLAVGESSFGGLQHVPGQMEASFLVTLFKFVQWPTAGSNPTSATICFLKAPGSSSVVQSRLEAALLKHERWTELPGRNVIVRVLSQPEELASSPSTPPCQILYLDHRSAAQFWPIHLLPHGVLTVSDQKDFAYHQGGMIQFIWDSSDTYRIAINSQNVTDSGLVVSGALGTLADRVDSARFGP